MWFPFLLCCLLPSPPLNEMHRALLVAPDEAAAEEEVKLCNTSLPRPWAVAKGWVVGTMRVYFWVRSGLPAKENSQAANMSG
jgi:hypothetical protein